MLLMTRDEGREGVGQGVSPRGAAFHLFSALKLTRLKCRIIFGMKGVK